MAISEELYDKLKLKDCLSNDDLGKIEVAKGKKIGEVEYTKDEQNILWKNLRPIARAKLKLAYGSKIAVDAMKKDMTEENRYTSLILAAPMPALIGLALLLSVSYTVRTDKIGKESRKLFKDMFDNGVPMEAFNSEIELCDKTGKFKVNNEKLVKKKAEYFKNSFGDMMVGFLTYMHDSYKYTKGKSHTALVEKVEPNMAKIIGDHKSMAATSIVCSSGGKLEDGVVKSYVFCEPRVKGSINSHFCAISAMSKNAAHIISYGVDSNKKSANDLVKTIAKKYSGMKP